MEDLQGDSPLSLKMDNEESVTLDSIRMGQTQPTPTPVQETEPTESVGSETSQETQPEQLDSRTKDALNKAREMGSKATEAIELLLSLDNKEQALNALKSKPAIYNEAKKRFPDALAKLESSQSHNEEEVSELPSKIVDRLESELQFERVYKAKEFAKEYGLNEDEYMALKRNADDFNKQGIDYERSLKSALYLVNPDKMVVMKQPEKQARTEIGNDTSTIEGMSSNDVNRYNNKGFTNPDVIKHVAKLEKMGGKVSMENGAFSMTL